jgi:acyl-CoA dehydrogenase
MDGTKDQKADYLPRVASGELVMSVREVAKAFDRKPAQVSDPDVSMRVSCAKLFCTEMAGRVADRGVQVHGGAGYINEYPVERFYRDVRLLRLYEGTTQIQQIIIGRELIGRN